MGRENGNICSVKKLTLLYTDFGKNGRTIIKTVSSSLKKIKA